MVGKNEFVCKKWKFWSKVEILVKIRSFGKKRKFLVKNGNFDQEWKVWSKIEILDKNGNFGPQSKNKIEKIVSNF